MGNYTHLMSSLLRSHFPKILPILRGPPEVFALLGALMITPSLSLALMTLLSPDSLLPSLSPPLYFFLDPPFSPISELPRAPNIPEVHSEMYLTPSQDFH